MTTTTTRPTIAQSLQVIQALAASPEPPEAATIAVLHLGHPSDAKFGTIEMMTPAEYEKFVWMNTWPRPLRTGQRSGRR